MAKNIIELKNIGKKYQLKKPKLFKLFSKTSKQEFWAIKNVSLNIKPGSNIGIFGPNGAGKTTLLQIIAGITKPNTGQLKVRGKVITLMDLTSGFQPDLNGLQNIYLNGVLAGMDISSIKTNLSNILNFAGINSQFIQTPFHTYSAGMKFRLALAVAIYSQTDILIIDEVLTAGDTEFQIQTAKKISHLQKKSNITTIISSHIPLFIYNFAKEFYYIKNGIISSVSQSDTRQILESRSHSWRQHFVPQEHIDKLKS